MNRIATPQTDKGHPISPPGDEKEIAALVEILSLVFHTEHEYIERYIKRLGRENFRVIRVKSEVAGGLAMIHMGQFFGGQSVPMTGIALVGTAPEFRGQGLAIQLMNHVVGELNESGVALSSLYPAVWPLYRKSGYENAGGQYKTRIDIRSMHMRERDYDVRRITVADHQAIEDVYRDFAVMNNGTLDRNDFMWQRVREPRGEPGHGFLVTHPTTHALEGYVYYRPVTIEQHSNRLVISDIVATAPEAGRRLWSFLFNHSSLVEGVTCFLHPGHPLIALLPDKAFQTQLDNHWMMRITNVKSALESRGYRDDIQAEFHFDIHDDIIESHNRNYLLQLKGGKAQVTQGGRGEIAIDIRGLASLYSGFATPHDLAITGLLETSMNKEDVDPKLRLLASAFAGPPSWLPDMF